MKLVFATILAVLAGTAMSASILHKEIEIGHNGVHYKVVVDAEKDQHDTTHSLDDQEHDSSENEHQSDIGNIGVSYEVPDSEHLHHHDEEDKHHGVIIHIDLGGVHDSEDEHHHLPHHEHHNLVHHEEHHGQLAHGGESHGLKHHIHSELDHHDLEHEGWNPHDTEHHQVLEDLNSILKNHDSHEDELEHGPSYLGGYSHQDLAHGPLQVWGPNQHHILAHQRGNIHHLLHSKGVTPIKVHSLVPYPPHVQLGNVYDQAYFHQQPFAGLDQLHHHLDIHH